MISVVVATFKQPATLRWILESLARQESCGDFEVLVCDDGSEPDTLSMLKATSRRLDLDVRYIWQPDCGYRLGRSRNNGIRCAKGDVIIFIDGDIIVTPTFISMHEGFHQTNSTALIGGTRSNVEIDLNTSVPRSLEALYEMCRSNAHGSDAHVQRRLFQTSLPWTACWGFNYSVRNSDHVWYDEAIEGWGNEDYDLFCRLYHRHGYRVEFTENIDVYHLTSRDGAEWNPWLSNDSRQIERYVRSSIALKEKYPDIDVTEALWPLQFFEVDARRNEWRRSEKARPTELGLAIRTAESWCQTSGDA
jgi:glycosyltransferase involved in cell wall biosynthesis